MEATKLVESFLEKILKRVPAVTGVETFTSKGYDGAGLTVHFKRSSYVLRITNLRTGK